VVFHQFSDSKLAFSNYRQIDGIAPTFAKKPAIRQEDDGKRLIFECRIEADPTPMVNWWHNAAQVNPDSRHKVGAVKVISEYALI
jgi:hypothetical protein